jgi:hypothetical protein
MLKASQFPPKSDKYRCGYLPGITVLYYAGGIVTPDRLSALKG